MPGAHVKIESRPFPVTYTVTGARDTFDFSGPFWAPADIIVLVNGVALLPADFTVVGNFIQDGDTIVGAYGGGTVVLDVAVSNCAVQIERLVVATRESDYGTTGPLPQNALNSDLDKLTAREQDIIARLGISEGVGLSSADVRAIVVAMLIAGTNITITPVGDTLVFAAAGGGGGGGADTDLWSGLIGTPAAMLALAALTPAADRLAYFDSSSTAALATLTSYGRSLVAAADASTARGTLGLGTAAVVALTTLLQAANNLSDLGSASAARTNLGLGSAALLASSAVAMTANNLSDLLSAATARTNLGLGTAATHPATDFLLSASNLSDLVSASAARSNLGLGALALLSTITASLISDPTNVKSTESFIIAVSDETTSLTTGTAKVTFRIPYAFTLTQIRASLNTVSSSGTPTFDVKKNGTTVFSTLLSIDASEKTSQTAATPAVLSTTSLADDDEITIDVTVAGAGAKGAKLVFIGHRT